MTLRQVPFTIQQQAATAKEVGASRCRIIDLDTVLHAPAFEQQRGNGTHGRGMLSNIMEQTGSVTDKSEAGAWCCNAQ
jgi:hypothetical protein